MNAAFFSADRPRISRNVWTAAVNRRLLSRRDNPNRWVPSLFHAIPRRCSSIAVHYEIPLPPANTQRRRRALVRLRRPEEGAVEVRFCAVRNRAVSNRNCVAAMRGGEQRNENDQSVTQVVQRGRRRELDSVGVDGRVCYVAGCGKSARPVWREGGRSVRSPYPYYVEKNQTFS